MVQIQRWRHHNVAIVLDIINRQDLYLQHAKDEEKPDMLQGKGQDAAIIFSVPGKAPVVGRKQCPNWRRLDELETNFPRGCGACSPERISDGVFRTENTRLVGAGTVCQLLDEGLEGSWSICRDC
jgi:hypothetical protein